VRPRRPLATAAVQAARALDLIQLATDLRHAIADNSPVCLDLGLAGTAEEAETAALPLEVGPAPDQPPGLIIEMRKLDLQPAFRRGRTLAENLQDKAGAIDHFRPDLIFQILLLDRRQRRIDDQQMRAAPARRLGKLLDLTLAEQRRRPDGAHADSPRPNHIDTDGSGKALGLFDPRLRRPPRTFARKLGHGDQRALAAGDLDRAIAVVEVQGPSSVCFTSCSGSRSSGCAGCSVEIACLYTS
jgi:hypothetical protein